MTVVVARPRRVIIDQALLGAAGQPVDPRLRTVILSVVSRKRDLTPLRFIKKSARSLAGKRRLRAMTEATYADRAAALFGALGTAPNHRGPRTRS